MIANKDLRNGVADSDGETSRNKLSRPNFEPNKRYPDDKDVVFLRDS
ncbi:protein OBERON 3-like, partial [Trifolium medium]|nr:protein OBERON 3-like [Trifolium medium]